MRETEGVSITKAMMQLLTTYFRGGVKRLRKLWVDDGYSGAPLRNWVRALKKTHKIDLDVSGRMGPGFKVVAKRWVVERTFGWLNLRRRLSKDYEVLIRNSEAMIHGRFHHRPHQAPRLSEGFINRFSGLYISRRFGR
jgi:transposase